jgi:ribosomal protein S18 acetylase RimI-like enzyme
MSLQEVPPILAFPITEYSADIDAGIARLMPMLDANFSDLPQPERLQRIINSPSHDQLVAVRASDQLVVGAASMTVVMGYGLGMAGRLEDFVVDSEARRQGVAATMWGSMMDWCMQRGLAEMVFETERDRPEALAFYEKMGAVIVKDSNEEKALHLKAKVLASV